MGMNTRKLEGETAMKTNEQCHRMYQTYFCIIVLAGLGTILGCCYEVMLQSPGFGWIALGALTCLAGSMAIKIPGVNSRVSVAEVSIIASLLLFGPVVGCLTAALDGVFGSLRCKTGSRRMRFLAFNAALMGLAAFAAGTVFSVLIGHRSLVEAHATLNTTLLPLLLLVAVYYLLNTMGVAMMVGLEKRQDILAVWRRNFLWLCGNYTTAGMIALLLTLNGGNITGAIVAAMTTALAASYTVCSLYLRREVNVA
jgi:hypothetical protein